MNTHARNGFLQVDQIEGLLQRRTLGRVRDLRVEMHDDVVVLSGRAQSYYAKQLAQQAALDTVSCELLNEIEVC